MDALLMNLQEAFYMERFENSFLRSKGEAFQSFFEKLMGLAHQQDFMASRPWGRDGDRKNDGFLKSERRLFQVYAPNQMDKAKAIEKITADFAGAKEYWGEYFDKWTFVHNAEEGLPPHVQKEILAFEKQNPGIKLDTWGLEKLRDVFRRIPTEKLGPWLGEAPTEATRAALGFKDLQVVLESLAARETDRSTPTRVVPPGKIEANDLSGNVSTLIKSGMTKARLVWEFFEAWHDETLGERLAVAFREKYESLRGTMHPNRVFSELQAWAGGSQRGSPEHEMAVLAVLAYYFERCDIFEASRDSEP